MLKPVLSILLAALLSGCMHIQGVAEEAPGVPSTTAVLSVGRPDGIAAPVLHRVDRQGRFDFWMPAIDETDLYVYDSQGDPRHTMRRIDRRELGSNMRLFVPSAARRSDPFGD